MDRDGTLTEEVGYVNHHSRLRLLLRAADAIRRLNEAGLPAVVVSSQAGIARGYFWPEVRRATVAVAPDHVATDLLDAVAWIVAGPIT
jgi:histidinol phosphatase-like enzyme